MNLGFLVPAACCAGWAVALCRRAPEGRLATAASGLTGGFAAFGAAWGGYALLERAGMPLSWDHLLAGGGGGLVAAGAIGLVEEGAKLLGLALAALLGRDPSGAAMARRVLLVCAAFASFECAFTLGGAPAPLLVVRALLAPVAHAALAVPLGLALASGARRARWVPLALLVAAALHGAGDLALALPALGRVGYGVALAAPVVGLYLYARRTLGPAPERS